MSARLGRLLAAALALGTFVTGCASSGSDGRGVPDAGGHTYARLSVVVTVPRDGAGSVGATARLLRYRGVDVESAQVLAGTPVAARQGGGGGSCALIDDEALLDDALATSPPDASVQMLDAGDLLVHVAGQTLKVSPRYVPEIVPFVSGVVYEAEAQSVDPLTEGSSREESFVAAFGGQQIGRFVAPAEVPAPPRIEHVSDDGAPEIEVAWSQEGAPAGGTVEIVVGGELGPSLRCRYPDTGRATIPGDALGRVRDATRGGPLTLAVERTRRTPFSAPGLEGADIEVSLRDVVTLR